MSYLIKNAKLYDKGSEWHLKKVDILIKRGKIVEIGNDLSDEKAKLVTSPGLCVSPGWIDIGTTLTEPGFEDLDDIRSLSESAAAGGFTALAVFPNTQPVLDTKGSLDSLKMRSANELVDFLPIGALTVGNKGTDIAEMTDMKEAGAIAFSDGKFSIQHAGVLKRALRYIINLDSLIINHPNDKSLSETGIMNESGESAYLGLKGIPALAEEICLNRDIELCKYTDSRLLSHMITTKGSVKMVRKAKQSDLKLFASVSYHNLVASDEMLKSFDPMHKVLPPLRGKADISALLRGLQDDSIDCIVSNHRPLDVEEKKKAFYYADFGALGLEILFSVVNTKTGNRLPLEVLVDKLSNGPRKILNLPSTGIQENTEANLTLFDPERKWTFDKNAIRSKSNNAPFLGEEFSGKVLGVMANGKTELFE